MDARHMDKLFKASIDNSADPVIIPRSKIRFIHPENEGGKQPKGIISKMKSNRLNILI